MMNGTGSWCTAELRIMKGTGFSPYINAREMTGALAPEGTQFLNYNSRLFPQPLERIHEFLKAYEVLNSLLATPRKS